jgi:hypothetical protein
MITNVRYKKIVKDYNIYHNKSPNDKLYSYIITLIVNLNIVTKENFSLLKLYKKNNNYLIKKYLT